MVVQRGDVKLVRLKREAIELVRTWRNTPEIQSRMEYREYITAEMQVAWFESIDNINNFYFLVSVHDQYIGLIHAARIDWNKKIAGNCGIFIWDKKHLESASVTEASLLFTDIGFCCGVDRLYAKILADNTASVFYNKAIGYSLLPGQEQVANQVYELTSDVYFNATAKLRAYAKLGNKVKITFSENEAVRFNFLMKWFAAHPETYGINVSVEIEP